MRDEAVAGAFQGMLLMAAMSFFNGVVLFVVEGVRKLTNCVSFQECSSRRVDVRQSRTQRWKLSLNISTFNIARLVMKFSVVRYFNF